MILPFMLLVKAKGYCRDPKMQIMRGVIVKWVVAPPHGELLLRFEWCNTRFQVRRGAQLSTAPRLTMGCNGACT